MDLLAEFLRLRSPRRVGSYLPKVFYWSAILLPLIYLPLLVSRIETTQELVVFLVLVGLHIVALIGGRSYRRTTSR